MNLYNAIFGDPQTEQGRIASEIAQAMQGYRLLDRASGALMPNSEMDDLGLEDRRLSIAMKRRSLGLPMDSDDLEQSMNEGTSFTTQMRNLAGTRMLQSIPSPGLLQGAETAVSHVRLPYGEVSTMARDMLSGLGGKYVSSIGRFFR